MPRYGSTGINGGLYGVHNLHCALYNMQTLYCLSRTSTESSSLCWICIYRILCCSCTVPLLIGGPRLWSSVSRRRIFLRILYTSGRKSQSERLRQGSQSSTYQIQWHSRDTPYSGVLPKKLLSPYSAELRKGEVKNSIEDRDPDGIYSTKLICTSKSSHQRSPIEYNV